MVFPFCFLCSRASSQAVWKMCLDKLVPETVFGDFFFFNYLHSLDFCWIISRHGPLKYFKINFAWNTVNPLISMLRLFFTPGRFPCSCFSLLLLFCSIYSSKASLIRLSHWLSVSLVVFCFVLFLSFLPPAPLHYIFAILILLFNIASADCYCFAILCLPQSVHWSCH